MGRKREAVILPEIQQGNQDMKYHLREQTF